MANDPPKPDLTETEKANAEKKRRQAEERKAANDRVLRDYRINPKKK